MKPAAVNGESGGITPAAFRALMTSILGAGAQGQGAPSETAPQVGYAPPATIKGKFTPAKTRSKR